MLALALTTVMVAEAIGANAIETSESGTSFHFHSRPVPIWGMPEPERSGSVDPEIARFVNDLRPGLAGSYQRLYRHLEQVDMRTRFSGFVESETGITMNFSMHIPGDGRPTTYSITYTDENASLRLRAINRRLRTAGLQCNILPDGKGARRIVLFKGYDTNILGIELFVIDQAFGGYDLNNGPWAITAGSTVLANPQAFVAGEERRQRQGDSILREYDSSVEILKRIALREITEEGWNLIASYLWLAGRGAEPDVDTAVSLSVLDALIRYTGAHELAHRDLNAPERLAYLADIAYGPAPRRALGALLQGVDPFSMNAEERAAVTAEVRQKLPEFMRERKRRLAAAGLDQRKSPMGQIHRLPENFIREFAVSLIGENQKIRALYQEFANRSDR